MSGSDLFVLVDVLKGYDGRDVTCFLVPELR